jgi:hypothetical protein
MKKSQNMPVWLSKIVLGPEHFFHKLLRFGSQKAQQNANACCSFD